MSSYRSSRASSRGTTRRPTTSRIGRGSGPSWPGSRSASVSIAMSSGTPTSVTWAVKSYPSPRPPKASGAKPSPGGRPWNRPWCSPRRSNCWSVSLARDNARSPNRGPLPRRNLRALLVLRADGPPGRRLDSRLVPALRSRRLRSLTSRLSWNRSAFRGQPDLSDLTVDARANC
jgi:hypothetical protein